MLSRYIKKVFKGVGNICTHSKGSVSIFFVFCVFGLDFVTKYYFAGAGLVKNTGISFGLFSSSVYDFYLLIVIAIIVFILALFWIREFYCSRSVCVLYPLSLILGGGLGNLYDRYLFGYVRDFISLPSFWPTYNIADVAISIGLILLVISSLKGSFRIKCTRN